MGFMGAAVGIGDVVGELGDGEEAVGFDDAAFGEDPGRFDGVEPRALDRQVAGDDADAAALLLDLPVMVADPVATRWLTCQGALSQIRTSASLPAAWSLRQHQSR